MKKLSKSQIREIFLANGFTIKEGESDLKQYVYDAATALLKAHVVCLKYYMDELIKAQAETEHTASMTEQILATVKDNQKT